MPKAHDVSDSHPDVVKRLQAFFDRLDAQAVRKDPPERPGGGGIRRLTGGQLRYDLEPKPGVKADAR